MILRLGSAALMALPSISARAGQRPDPCRNPAVIACTPQLVDKVQQLRATLDSLAGLGTPADASAADRPTAVRFGTWLRDAAGRVAAQEALAGKVAAAPKPGTARINYFLQTVTLRNRLLEEADRFSFTSNALKVRHDVAMSSIRNIK